MRSRFRHGLMAIAVAMMCTVASAWSATAATTTTQPVHTRTANTATVAVDATTTSAIVPSTAIGINGSTYDGALTDTAVPGLLSAAGTNLIRFPGGTSSDTYNWRTNTDVVSGLPQAVNFDQYATLLGRTGAQGMITVNYGTGDTAGAGQSPAESGAQFAADWVRYANVTKHYGIKYWEIGNEIYGNGTYGADWEPDQHCTATSNPTDCGPAVYAKNAAAYIAAMKAVDPSIVVGVVLTAPGNWPDGSTSAGSPQAWNQTVLSALGNQIGFADIHWYPQNPSTVTPPGPTDAGLLGDSANIPAMTSSMRSLLSQYTGTNSVSSNPGKQTLGIVNALFLPQDYLTWLANGVSSVDWWQIHNGIVTTGDNGSGLAGTATYGDYGVLSDATCSGATCEPAADTPFPAYYGLKLLGGFIHPGDSLVGASSTASLLQSYAVKGADGDLRVMLVNDDPANSYAVNLNYTGFSPSGAAPVVATLTAPGAGITTAPGGSAGSQTIAPYTAEVITLQPGSAVTPPTTPGTPTASAVTSTSVGLSWAASTSSAGVAGYDVVQVNAGTEKVVAGPATNAATITGLTPSTTYTFAVYAKDAAGNRSARSGTVTVTTSAGNQPSGGCRVAYAPSVWPGGFTANVTLTNTGTSAWPSWTATFAFPGDERVSNAWNAAVTQNGATVTANNVSYNGNVAPGASTTFGFQGTWSAGSASPTAFTVNGNACTKN
jgi:hypothetical protein